MKRAKLLAVYAVIFATRRHKSLSAKVHFLIQLITLRFSIISSLRPHQLQPLAFVHIYPERPAHAKAYGWILPASNTRRAYKFQMHIYSAGRRRVFKPPEAVT